MENAVNSGTAVLKSGNSDKTSYIKWETCIC